MAAAKAKTGSKPPSKSAAKGGDAEASSRKAKTAGAAAKTAAAGTVAKKPAAKSKVNANVRPAATATAKTPPKAAAKSSRTKAFAAGPAENARVAVSVSIDVPVNGPTPTPAPASVGTPSAPLSPRSLVRGDFVLEKLHQVALTATNLDISLAFYRDVLGLKFIARMDPPGLAYFSLGGGARLLLSGMASQASLHFAVDDINSAVNELKKRGVSFMQPPALIHRDDAGHFGKKGIEEWMAFFRDPSGNMLALVQRR